MRNHLQAAALTAALFAVGNLSAAVTGTVLNPNQTPLAGVVIFEPGCPENTVESGLDGTFIHPFDCALGVIRAVNNRLEMPENARVEVFDVHGRRLAAFSLGAAGNELIRNTGILFVRYTYKDVTSTIKLVNQGGPLSIRTAPSGGGQVLARQGGAKGVVKPLMMTKIAYAPSSPPTYYADKTFQMEDGQDYRINFGGPIGRVFNPDTFPKHEGFNLELAEEFDRPFNLRNTDAVWRASDGTWNDNAARFVPEYASFKDGYLVLKMDDTHQPGGDESATEGENYLSGTYIAGPKDFSAAEIRTRHQNYRFGYYEVAIDPPDSADAEGFLSAMFSYHVPAQEYWREIDIEVEGNNPDKILTNVFQLSGTTAWNAAGESVVRPSPEAPFNSREQHTYAFKWLPDSITWYVDGKEVRHFVDETDGTNVAVSWLNHKVMINFWLCCNGGVGGPWTNNFWPIESKVDFFRFYRWDHDADYDLIACRDASHVGCN